MSYSVGVRYWIPDEDHAWLVGNLKELKNDVAEFQMDKEVRKFRVADLKPKLEPCGGHIDDNVENLVDLDELSEGAILHHIRKRFAKKIIYTHVGSILVAVNPFENLPIYSEKDIKKAFTSTQMYPHVFCTASLAFSQLKMNRKNQSVLISGESGAGKTETTKKVLTFLASVASPSHHSSSQVGIETKILQSNPLLEALGNAKTLRNNNSSRFGKWMKVGFNDSFTIQGCEIINYLLEKSRVVGQSVNERNYHIFYQLLAGATKDMKVKYNLRRLDEYYYLNQSGCSTIDGVDDSADFQDVLTAMKTLEFSNVVIDNIFKVISSILLLGNMQYEMRSKDKDDASVTENSEKEYLQPIFALLDVDPVLFRFALTEKRVQMGRGSVVNLKLNIPQAIDCRDTLAKTLYSHLFDWTIQQVNETLQPGGSSGGKSSKATPYSIGILDIFGFEVFELNSFEQLCINYANEKLQQHFNDVIFQEEMKMYVEEGISLQHIEFEDNQQCVSLIENKPFGVLALLEEECSLGNATDLTFINKLDKTFGNVNNKASYNKYFVKNKVKPDCFSVAHFAGLVEYNVINFLDKNRDNLSVTIKEVLMQSKNQFVTNLFSLGEGTTVDKSAGGGGGGAEGGRKGRGGGGAATSSKSTLGTQFRNQLIGLVTTLKETEPHFIRCVKPNHEKVSQKIDGNLALRQMKYAGLFEAIRIRKSGYAYRVTHAVFVQQYHVLIPMLQKKVHSKAITPLQACEQLRDFLFEKNILPNDRMHIGKATRVFLKSTSDRLFLEQAKQSIILVYVVKIQQQVRKFLNYLYYAKELILLKKEKQKMEDARNRRGNAIQNIQAIWRGYSIRKMLKSMHDFFLLRKALKAKKIPLIKDTLYRIDKEYNILTANTRKDEDESASKPSSPAKSLANIWEATVETPSIVAAKKAKSTALKTAIFKLFAHEIKVGKVMLKLLEIQDTFMKDLTEAIEKHQVSKLNALLLKSERLEMTTHPLVMQAKELIFTLYEKRNVMKDILSFLQQFHNPHAAAVTNETSKPVRPVGVTGSVKGSAKGTVRGGIMGGNSTAANEEIANLMEAIAVSSHSTYINMNEEDIQRLIKRAKVAQVPQEFLDKVLMVYQNISPRLKTRNKLRFAIETMNRYEMEQNVMEILQIRLHYHLFAEIELRAARTILQWLQWESVLFPSNESSTDSGGENNHHHEEDEDEKEEEDDDDDDSKDDSEHGKQLTKKNHHHKPRIPMLWGQPMLTKATNPKLPPEYRDICQSILDASFPSIKAMHEKRLQAAVNYNVHRYYELIRCFKMMKTVCIWRYPEVLGVARDGATNPNDEEHCSGLGGSVSGSPSRKASTQPESPSQRMSGNGLMIDTPTGMDIVGNNDQNHNNNNNPNNTGDGSTASEFYSFRLAEVSTNPYIIKCLHPDFDMYLQQSYSATMDAAMSNLEMSSSMQDTLQQLDLLQEIDKEIVLPNGQRYHKTVTKNPRYHDKYGTTTTTGRGGMGASSGTAEGMLFADTGGMNLAGMGMTGFTVTTTTTANTVGMNSRLLQSTVSNSGKKVSYTMAPGLSSMVAMMPGSTPKKQQNTVTATGNTMMMKTATFATPGKGSKSTPGTPLSSSMKKSTGMFSPNASIPSSPMAATAMRPMEGEVGTPTASRRRSFLPPNIPVKLVENLPAHTIEKQLYDSRVSKEKEFAFKLKEQNREIRNNRNSNWY